MKSYTKDKSDKDIKPKHFWKSVKKRTINFKSFIKKHSNTVIPISICLINFLIIAIFCAAWSIKTNEANPIQNYYIDIFDKDDLTIDCNLVEYDDSLACASKEIFGTFSKYDSVELVGAEVDEDNFKFEFSYSVPKDFYETVDFNLDNFPDEKEVSHLIGLYDRLLDKTILSKEVKIVYKFSESDKNLISEAHSKWQEGKDNKQAETETQNQAKINGTVQATNDTKREETENEQGESEEHASPETEFPAELENRALDSCYRKFYKETSRAISRQPDVNHNYWSGIPYIQTIVIDDLPQGFRVVCSYNWKIGIATSINIEDLPY